MGCGPCVQNLALQLVANHPKLDLIRAYELADRAIERVEARDPKPLTPPAAPLSFCYTKICGACPAGYCLTAADPCSTIVDCEICDPPSCPAADPHGHLTTNTCTCSMDGGCTCVAHKCGGSPGTCRNPLGSCYYDCDPGYVCVGGACVPAAAARALLMDGLVFIS
jgi:hypothetical protein